MSTVLLVIIVVAVAVLLLRKPSSSGSGQFSYRRKPYLLSKAERSFYGVLCQAVGDNALIFCKVRVADVLAPQKGLNRPSWQQAFNKISAKHFDFLLCDSQDCAVKLAIELDDASHGSAKRQKRDAFLEQACESAGLPLLRIRAARGYGVVDIRQQIEAVLFPVLQGSSLEEPGQLEGMGAEVTTNEQERVGSQSESQAGNEKEAPTEAEVAARPVAPACHQCGEVMVLRKARSGKNAGQQFWGCSAFPKCRGVVKC
ncbi:MAG: ssDNA-binding Zn-finger/Zn-ribbon topoisomerase 1 [Alcanivorax sp.]|jgi:ssDNA-binding Zn-finger/Zn-ribbon topoisomerase 1|uniref:DUF2726 domain-containing protein n=1 Tax=Alcanivorax sp. TaxID=1872427 RepID=UPI0039E2DEEC